MCHQIRKNNTGNKVSQFSILYCKICVYISSAIERHALTNKILSTCFAFSNWNCFTKASSLFFQLRIGLWSIIVLFWGVREARKSHTLSTIDGRMFGLPADIYISKAFKFSSYLKHLFHSRDNYYTLFHIMTATIKIILVQRRLTFRSQFSWFFYWIPTFLFFLVARDSIPTSRINPSAYASLES